MKHDSKQQCRLIPPILFVLAGVGVPSFSFLFPCATTTIFKNREVCNNFHRPRKKKLLKSFLKSKTLSRATAIDGGSNVKVGDLLSDLQTPSLLLELSLLERYFVSQNMTCSVDAFLRDPLQFAPQKKIRETFVNSNAVFIHTSVTSTKKRDTITAEENGGSGKSLVVCDVDTPYKVIEQAGGAYLGLGLANHHVGGYYWARSMGIGAASPAHGIYFRESSDCPQCGELYWKKRGPGNVMETTEESSNSNDGKRSEWADFLKSGDTVQLVPIDPFSMLLCPLDQTKSSPLLYFDELIGIRRSGRPLGADPIVEQVWRRKEGQNSWLS